MAQILPYQRQTNDAPGLGVQPSVNPSNAVAQGLSDLAGGMGNVAASMKEREDKSRALQSSLAMATLNNDLRDLHDETANGIRDGSIPTDKAMSAFNEKASAIRDRTFEGLTPQQQQQLSPDYLNISGGLTRNLNLAMAQRSQSEAAGTIDQFAEQTQRSASRIGPAAAAEKFAAFVDFAAGNAGLSPERTEKMKQSFKEGVFLNAFQAAGNTALTKSDAEGLAEVRRQLMSDDGSPIDPQKREVLQRTLYGWEQGILAKRNAAENSQLAAMERRDKAASDITNKAMTLSISGQTYDPEFVKELAETTAGTRSQGLANELLNGQNLVSGFATKTAPDRAAILERWQADSSAAGTSPGKQELLKQLRTVNEQVIAAQKENPWAAAQRSGVITDAQVFDAAKPDSAFGIVQKRMESIGKVEQWTGSKVSPFQPQEIVQLSKAVKSLTPEQQAPYLGKLGETIGDIDRINIVAEEMDKTNRPLALALRLGTDRTTAGRAVTEFALRGAQGLADNTIKRDDTVLTGWKSEIAKMVRGTMGDTNAENDIIESAYLVRAGLDAEGAEVPGFGRADQSNENAVKMVIGQPLERAGVKTILPRGFTESMFNDKLKTLTPTVLTNLAPVFYSRGVAIKPEQLAGRLQEFGMRRDGTGRYIPVSNGAPITLDAAGTNPLRIKVQ